MRTYNVIGVIAAAFVLASCGQATPPPVTPGSAFAPSNHAKSAAAVYISDSAGAFVDVFKRDGKLVRKITDGLKYPIELFVDAKHDLWVADQGANAVLKFKPGASKPTAYTGVTAPWAATTCPDGTLYVTNFSESIAAFAPGHRTPTGSLSESYGAAESIACDSAGNLFVTATVLSPPAYVVEFPAGSRQAKLLITLPNPVDVKPTANGKLLVLDSAGGSLNAIAVYTEDGKATGKTMPTGDNWLEMAPTANDKTIFGADLNELEGTQVRFPSDRQTHTYRDSKFTVLGGIAYDPG